MGDLISAVLGFLEDVFEVIENLKTWIGDLAERIESVSLSANSSVTLVLGNYRYLAGDTLHLITISTFYVGVFMIAFKVIPIVVSWWKHFSPNN